MEIYDQHEQSERVRSWLKDNAAAILTGIVIGLGAIFGYHQWQNHQVRHAYTAAELYERARLDAAAAQTPADPATTGSTPVADPEGLDAVRSQLRNEYPKSGFAILAALEQAEAQLAAKDPAAARASLTWARDNSREPALTSLAALRLARLELADGQADEALKVVDAMGSEGFVAQRAELRGDIHAVLGHTEQAKAAYAEARDAPGGDSPRLEMKLSQYGPVDAVAPAGEGA